MSKSNVNFGLNGIEDYKRRKELRYDTGRKESMVNSTIIK
jgi:hypothetical protein